MATVTESAAIETDPDMIERFLAALVPGVYEIRIPRNDARRPRFYGGQVMYLHLPDDLEVGAGKIASVTGQDAAAVYIVGNPVNPALLGRGRAGFYPLKSAASDIDVIARRLLYVDIDAERPSAINATPDEAAAAMARTAEAAAWLSDALGFPAPMFHGTSGSGGMLLYRLDLPNAYSRDGKATDATVAATEQVQGCLAALSERFPADGVKIDTSVYNAARIFRVPGTVNAKSNTPQPDRPWSRVTGTFANGVGVRNG